MSVVLFPLFAAVLLSTSLFVWASESTHQFMKQFKQKQLDNARFVCPFIFACRMLTSSSLLILNVIHGLYCGTFDCAALIFVSWLTSLNYWRHPTEGMRRVIDLIWNIISVIYHFCVSFEITDGYTYRVGVYSFCLWYIAALYFGRIRDDKNLASICHVNIHSTAIVFNIWLFPKLYVSRHAAMTQ